MRKLKLQNFLNQNIRIRVYTEIFSKIREYFDILMEYGIGIFNENTEILSQV